MQVYLPDTQSARKELTRLQTIESDLLNKIEQLNNNTSHTASTWISIYTDRLNVNVRPAITECQRYLASQDTPLADIYGG